MTLGEIRFDWQGPFALAPDQQYPLVYDQPGADGPGLYLWITQVDDRPYLHYVGIASQSGSLAQRQREHMSKYLSGHYTLYDPALFRQGEKRVLFSKDHAHSFNDFLGNLRDYQQAALQLAGCMRVYLCRLDSDKPWLERIESAVIRQLREAQGEAAKMLDNLRLSRWVEEAERVRVSTKGWPDYAGKPAWLAV